jgi:O-antigen ligase
LNAWPILQHPPAWLRGAGRLVLALLVCALGVLIGLTLWDPARLPLTVALISVTAVLLLITINPLLGLGVWVALSPFAIAWNLDIHLGAGIPDLALTRLAAGWTLVLLVARTTLGYRRLVRVNALDVVMLVFAAGILLSAFASTLGAVSAIQGVFDAYVLPMLVYALARNLVDDARGARWIAGVVLAIGAYLAFLVLQEQITGVPLFAPDTVQLSYGTDLRRVVSLLGNPVFFGIPLAFAMVVAMVALNWQTTLRGRVLLATLAMTFAVAGFFTFNRASWLGLVVGLVVVSLYDRRWWRFLLPVVVVAGLILALRWPEISQHPLVSDRLLREESVDDRLTNVNAAVALWQQHPVSGIGYANFGEVAVNQGLLVRIPDYVPAPHNSYLFVLTSGGLVAGVPYILILLLITFDLWRFDRFRRRVRRPDERAALVWRGMITASMAVLVIQAVTSATYDAAMGTLTSLVFFLIIGTTYGLHQAEHRRAVQSGMVDDGFAH